MTYFTSGMNGLLEKSDADYELMEQCMAGAVPYSDMAFNRNDHAKFISWDSSLENCLKHRAALIDHEGREKFLPWKLYSLLKLNWIDGLYLRQNTGDCCSFGHRNSLNYSNMVNAALRGDGVSPKEIAHSMTYAIAKGGGKPRFGSGLNLNPMAKYAADQGNYWTADFGRYDTGHYCNKYKGGVQDEHAKSAQSIIIPLPKPDFDLCYMLCAAGIGVNIGSGIYPSGSGKGRDGLASSLSFTSGGHAIALVAATTINDARYIYLVNSHGAKYAADTLHKGAQWGCWLDEKAFAKIAQGAFKRGDPMIFGDWYGNAGEL